MTRHLPAIVSALALVAAAGTALGQAGDAPAPATVSEQAAASGARQNDVPNAVNPAAAPHFEAARQAAGNEFLGPLLLCNTARPADRKWQLPSGHELRMMGRATDTPPPATRVFDNLVFFSTGNVSAWAVATSQGIILIDTLDNAGEARSIIEDGLRQVGLDPATIRYIVVTHGHGDHYGGSAYLQNAHGAPILMSAADWKLSPTTRDKQTFDPAPPFDPARDQAITDGEKLTLGDTTLTLYITPGHTPGTVSVMIPVRDHGTPRVATLIGGIGFNFPHTPARFDIYAHSAERLRALSQAAGATIALSNHPENDMAIAKAAAVRALAPGQPNPFVIGADGVRRFFTVFAECARAYGAQTLLKDKT